jgi:uncharacterized protein YndB with AHSA1/START domain
MTTALTITPDNERDLALAFHIAAPPAAIWRCWTEPALLCRWFCPPPWQVTHAEVDLRPGGANMVVMRGPEGQEFPNRGQYLEVVPNRRLIWTDAFTGGWAPSEKPFMTGVIGMEPDGAGTRYTAIARHWTMADREQHKAMGFFEGWTKATQQLEDTARSLVGA